MDFLWLDDVSATQNALAAGSGEWALDTEFMRERTFHPQLALLQLSWAGGPPLLLDTTLDAIAAAAAPRVRAAPVIAHSASEDLQALRHRLGGVPAKLFDTQVAAAFAGLGTGLGYQALLKLELGIDVPKGETRSDWLKRPLSEAQLAYAADDVRHLHALADRLRERLVAAGRLEWASADMERLRAQSETDADPPFPHLEMRSAAHLDPDGQARLSRLLRWRDREARERDLPRRWLLDNALAMDLARRAHWSRTAFDQLCDAQPKPPRRHREVLWQLARTPLADEEREVPLLREPPADERDRLRRLQQAVAAVATDLGLPETLLCSRRHLESLLANPRWPEALAGWRQPLLEPVLRPLLP